MPKTDDYIVTFARRLNEDVIVTATGARGLIKARHQGEDGGLLYFVRITSGGTDAWQRAEEMSDPAAPVASTVITSLQYLQLFTNDEQLAIVASTIPQVQQAVMLTNAAGEIDLASPIVTGGIDALVGFNLLTADRAARIKGGQPPVSSTPA